jgi:hypothetical protein
MSPLTQVVAGNRILASDLNAFYNLLKGVAASGEAITLIYNQTALIFQPSADPAAGTRVLDIKNNAGTHLMSIDFNGVLELLAAAAAPGGAVAGAVYFDTLLGTARIYDGAQWVAAGRDPLLWDWYWSPTMAIESTVTGTGTFTASTSNESASVATGATSGGTSGVRKVIGTVINVGVGTYGLKRWSFTAGFNEIDANTTEYIFLTDENVTGAPSLTARHIGIKNVAGVVSFTTADNTTEQTTAITAFVAAAQDYRFTVTFDGTTARLYVNGTLRATHATNVPTSTTAAPVFRAYAVNSAAANKTLVLGRQSASFAVV